LFHIEQADSVGKPNRVPQLPQRQLGTLFNASDYPTTLA
jgi:hypothetical protein